MFCTQCGANNPDNVLVCTQCGRSLQPGGTLTPAPAISVVVPTTVPNYLVFAILATVFCCLPLGIPAIVYAAQVNGKLQAGDLAGAQLASKNAKMWCLISAGVGLAICLLYGILIMAGVLGGLSHVH